MAQNSKCFTCKYQKECKETGWCIIEPEHTVNDMQWREYHESDSIMNGIDYADIVASLQQERIIDKEMLMVVAIRELDIRKQDFWYLINLNADQLIEEASKGR